jgi:hypothetical protein
VGELTASTEEDSVFCACSKEHNANVNVGAWDLILTVKNMEIILELLKAVQ